MRTRPIRDIAAALTVAATIAACGGGDDATDAGAGATSVAADASGSGAAATAMNDADVEFAQGMIAHHEQAIEMAELALDPAAGASPEVVDLATRIEANQDPEIDLMTGWLQAAGEPTAMDTSDGHDMSDMPGMMSVEDMDALAAATGPEFDRMWLEMMIAHHEGAISQSEDVRAEGSAPDVLGLAEEIISMQQAEIAEMEALLGG